MDFDGRAIETIRVLPKFDERDFRCWYESQVVIAGSNAIVRYLEEKKRWNTKAFPRYPDKTIKVDLSDQARGIIKMQKEFDINDFVIWFINALEISHIDIHTYLEAKHKKEQG